MFILTSERILKYNNNNSSCCNNDSSSSGNSKRTIHSRPTNGDNRRDAGRERAHVCTRARVRTRERET